MKTILSLLNIIIAAGIAVVVWTYVASIIWGAVNQKKDK